jgi:hypothetical protein
MPTTDYLAANGPTVTLATAMMHAGCAAYIAAHPTMLPAGAARYFYSLVTPAFFTDGATVDDALDYVAAVDDAENERVRIACALGRLQVELPTWAVLDPAARVPALAVDLDPLTGH